MRLEHHILDSLDPNNLPFGYICGFDEYEVLSAEMGSFKYVVHANFAIFSQKSQNIMSDIVATILLRNNPLIPICLRVLNRISRSTVSYAFLKSTKAV